MSPVQKTDGAGQPVGGRTVRDVVLDQHQGTGLYGVHGWFDPQLAADLLARLDLGEQRYGTPLMVGWEQAKQEIYQELLDALLYCIAARNWTVMHKTLLVLTWLRAK